MGDTTTTLACPGFVEFVEKGEASGEQLEVLAERLLAPIVSECRYSSSWLYTLPLSSSSNWSGGR